MSRQSLPLAALYIQLLSGSLIQGARAAEFDVGAGVEGAASASAESVGAGLRQVEVDALLGVGSAHFRLELDAVAAPMGWPEGLWVYPQIFPEWAAAGLDLSGGWTLGGGVRPLPSSGEALDGWNNPLVPYSQSFTSLWPGALLGGWVEVDRQVGFAAWGGVLTGPGEAPDPDQALIGGQLLIGEDALSGEIGLGVMPTDSYAIVNGALRAELGEPAELLASLWVTGWPDGLRAAMSATGILLPERPLNPTARLEWAPGAGPSDWAVDGGVRWRPEPFVQLGGTARIAGDQLGFYAGLSFFEEPSAR